MSPLEAMLAPGLRGSAADRFWRKVERRGPDECWLWTGQKTGRGYGRIATPLSSCTYAHRASVILDGRELPTGMLVDHTCRNILCVNPAHLRVVTPRINSIENSVGPTAINAAKTHCKNGHRLEGANLIIKKSGFRQCRCCDTNYQREYYRRTRGVKPENFRKLRSPILTTMHSEPPHV